MKHSSNHDWQPDPQLLAAYFDGELDGRAEVADLRARVEAWLEAHPDPAEDAAELTKLMRETAPPEPRESAWQEVRERIAAHQPPTRSRRSWLIAAAVAASVLLLIGILAGTLRSLQPKTPHNPPPAFAQDDIEVMAVATADEITILRIEEDDVPAMVVGTFPVSSPIELVDSGEVCIKCKCPRINVRQDPPFRPMIWARADTDK